MGAAIVTAQGAGFAIVHTAEERFVAAQVTEGVRTVVQDSHFTDNARRVQKAIQRAAAGWPSSVASLVEGYAQ